LIQTRLYGRRFHPSPKRVEALHLRLTSCLDPLRRLRTSASCSRRPEENFLRSWLSYLPFALPEYVHPLKLAIDLVASWLNGCELPTVVVHGDYGFHNILFDEAGAINGILDWDRSRYDGIAGYDELYLLMSSLEQCGICSYPQFIINLWQPSRRSARFQTELEFWLALIGLSERDAAYMGILLWVGLLFHGYVETPPPDASWLPRVAGMPAAALADAPFWS
jgi:hypothetical protein